MSKLAGECPHYLKQDVDTSHNNENYASLARIAVGARGGTGKGDSDWQCPKCGMCCFASHEECLRCGVGRRPPMRAELAAGSHAAWLAKQKRRKGGEDKVRPPQPKKVLGSFPEFYPWADEEDEVAEIGA